MFIRELAVEQTCTLYFTLTPSGQTPMQGFHATAITIYLAHISVIMGRPDMGWPR